MDQQTLVEVEVVVCPPGWQVKAGWVVALALMFLEVALALSPLIYVLSELF